MNCCTLYIDHRTYFAFLTSGLLHETSYPTTEDLLDQTSRSLSGNNLLTKAWSNSTRTTEQLKFAIRSPYRGNEFGCTNQPPIMPPLTLHVLPSAFFLPSISPDCIAAIAYLRYTQQHGKWIVVADAAEHPHLGILILFLFPKTF